MAGDAPALQLPNGWTKLKVFQLIANGWLEIGDGYRAKNSEMAKTGLPFIRAGDVNGRVNTTGVDLLGEASLGYVGNKRSQPGDAVITTKGTIGRMAFVRPDDPAFIYSPQLCFWRSLNPREIHPSWLYYALHSEEMRHQMSWSAAQTDMAPYISLSDQRSVFEITLPPIKDQIAIGSVLLSLDEKIVLNRQMAGTLEEMARALFKSWFVDFDPVHAKTEGRDTGLPADTAALFPDGFDEAGLPDGWRSGSLEDLADTNSESWKASLHPKEIAYVDLSNCKWGNIDGTTRYEWEDAPSRARRVARAGDTIFGTVRPGNGSYALVGRDGLTVSTGFAVLRPKKASYREIVYFAATNIDNIRWLEQLAAGHGGAYPAVNPDKVSATTVNVPCDTVAEAFASSTADMIDRIESLKQQSAELEQLRDTLLPKLLSGELPVADAETVIAAA